MACHLFNTGRCLQPLLFNRPIFGVHFRTVPMLCFLTKKRCPDTKKRKPLTSVSLFSSLGNRSMSPDLTPGACPHDYTNNSRNHQIFWQLFSLNNVQINLTLSRPFYRCGDRGPCGWACRRGDGRRGHARRRALQRPAWR